MSQAEQAVLPRRSTDAHGRAIPLSAEDGRRRAEEGIRALDVVLDMGDELEQRETFATLKAAIDEDRLSDRDRFGP